MEWISVKDRLPVRDDRYITYGIYGRTIKTFNVEYNCWDNESGDDYWCDAVDGMVTHWTPLLEPPEDEE